MRDWKHRLRPIDRNRLVIFGHVCAEGFTPEISLLFCPACGRAYLHLGSESLEWTYDGESFVPAADYSTVQARLGPDRWNQHTSNLFSRIETFLENRALPHTTHFCFMDGSKIPMIAEFPIEGRHSIKFTWCRSCGMGFCETWDPTYGWDAVASFVLERRYVLKTLIDETADALTLDGFLAKLPPPRADKPAP